MKKPVVVALACAVLVLGLLVFAIIYPDYQRALEAQAKIEADLLAPTHEVLFQERRFGSSIWSFFTVQFDAKTGAIGPPTPVRDLSPYLRTVYVRGEGIPAIPVGALENMKSFQFVVVRGSPRLGTSERAVMARGVSTLVLGQEGDVVAETSRWERYCRWDGQLLHSFGFALRRVESPGNDSVVRKGVSAVGCVKAGLWTYEMDGGIQDPSGARWPGLVGVVDDIAPLPGGWVFAFIRKHERGAGVAHLLRAEDKADVVPKYDFLHAVPLLWRVAR
ncbi:MAG: hypothetical protein KC416_01030 [Myxococcales bacterium]|nr:hypothetical protein [Myxococcales bacterium]